MQRANTYRHRMWVALATALLAGLGLTLLRPGPVSSRTAKEAFWMDKVHGSQRYEVVFSGDSRVYRGISPEALREGWAPLRLSALNFGFSAGGHNPEMFAAIDRRLTASGTRAVVLGLTPFSLTREGQENGHLHELMKTGLADRLVQQHVSPRLMFMDPIDEKELRQWVMRDSLDYYETFMPGGWVASRRMPLKPGEALKAYGSKFDSNQVAQGVVDTLLMQVRSWRRQGVLCFAFRPPSSGGMVALEDSLSGYREEELREAWEGAGGIWLDAGEDSLYVSYDGSHLDRRSAERLSRKLGAAMRPWLEGKAAGAGNRQE